VATAVQPKAAARLSPFWLLFILTGLNLFNYLDRYILPAVLTPLESELHIKDAESGRINSAFMLGYFLTAPFFGYLGDRISRKWLIAFGILIWSAGTVLTGFATGIGVLLFFRILVGLGEASYATISPGLISDAYEPERRNNALTIFYVAIPVGGALGYGLGGFIEHFFGWRNAFLCAGLPGLVLALVLLPFREPERGQADGQTVKRPGLRDFLGMFRLPNFHLVVWGYVAYTFSLGAFAYWGPSYLVRVHGMANQTAALFFGAVLLGAGLVGTFLGGFAATAWHKRTPAAYALVLGISVLLAVPVSFAAFLTSNTMAAMSCLAGAMFLLFLSTGPVNTLILESVPVNLRASAMATSIFMIHLFGDFRSSEIVGRLSDYWQSLQKAVLILPAVLLIASVLWTVLALKTCRTGTKTG
jgi:MFS family permease